MLSVLGSVDMRLHLYLLLSVVTEWCKVLYILCKDVSAITSAIMLNSSIFCHSAVWNVSSINIWRTMNHFLQSRRVVIKVFEHILTDYCYKQQLVWHTSFTQLIVLPSICICSVSEQLSVPLVLFWFKLSTNVGTFLLAGCMCKATGLPNHFT
jgi:hypothetical protein